MWRERDDSRSPGDDFAGWEPGSDTGAAGPYHVWPEPGGSLCRISAIRRAALSVRTTSLATVAASLIRRPRNVRRGSGLP